MMILVALLVLGVLIFVHELGHFLLAKFCGVGVLEFSIGFGKKIWKKRIGDTTYAVGAIPLGGYVKMVGEQRGDVVLTPEEKEELERDLEPRDREMLADKSLWFVEKGLLARFAIVFAGPFFNYMFAVIVSIASILTYGKGELVDKPIIGEVMKNLPAYTAGLRNKDLVKSIDGKDLSSWADLARTVAESGGREMTLRVVRDLGGEIPKLEEVEIRVTGSADTELKILEEDISRPSYKIGILPSVELKPATLLEAVEYGFIHTANLVILTFKGLKGMIMGHVSADNIHGPIYIVKDTMEHAKDGLDRLFGFVIFLSISLAVLNLLPVPVLDGGHLMFFTIEALKGSPVSLRFQGIANQVGMFLLLALMIFALGNDIAKLVK